MIRIFSDLPEYLLQSRSMFLKSMNIRSIKLVLFITGILSYSSVIPQPAGFKLTILHTNDVHCRVDGSNLGYAAVKAVHDSLKTAGENVLLLDAGDFSQGLPLGNFSRGAHIVRLMNKAGYDAAALGNHEFDFDASRIAELKDSMKFLLLTNARLKGSKTSMGHGFYHVLTFGSVQVGVIGVTTPETLTKSKPTNTTGYTFDEGDGELSIYLQNQIDAVKTAGADYVVVIGHLGVDQENIPWRSIDLIRATSGIDVFIDGHSHTVIDTVIQDLSTQDVLLVQTGSNSQLIGKIVIENSQIKENFISSVARKIDTGDKDSKGNPVMTANLEIYNMIKAINAELAPVLNKLVASTEVFLNGERTSPDTKLYQNGVRTGETNLGDLVADAFRYISGAQAALINGGSIRTSIKVGNITTGKLNEVIPFGDDVVTIRIPGSKFLEALEYGTRLAPDANAGFPQVSGLKFEVYTDQKTPNRVHNVSVNGKPIDPSAKYTVAINDFLEAGGDGYVMFTEPSVEKIANYSSLDVALITYITDSTHIWGMHGVVPGSGIYKNPDGEGRIVFTKLSYAESKNSDKEQVSVYPNPVENYITISNWGNIMNDVYLYDLSGILIRHYSPGNHTITANIHDIGNGVYLVKVITDKGMSVRRILKQ